MFSSFFILNFVPKLMCVIVFHSQIVFDFFSHCQSYSRDIKFKIIYIVIHRQTSLVLSELFSVARSQKLGSKLGCLKRQSKILPLSHEETTASQGNLNAYVSQLFLLYISYLPNPSAWAGYDTRSIFLSGV